MALLREVSRGEVSVLSVDLRGVEVSPLPGHAAVDTLPQVFLAGGDEAFKDLLQGDAAEAQADDLVGHLQEQVKLFRCVN